MKRKIALFMLIIFMSFNIYELDLNTCKVNINQPAYAEPLTLTTGGLMLAGSLLVGAGIVFNDSDTIDYVVNDFVNTISDDFKYALNVCASTGMIVKQGMLDYVKNWINNSDLTVLIPTGSLSGSAYESVVLTKTVKNYKSIKLKINSSPNNSYVYNVKLDGKTYMNISGSGYKNIQLNPYREIGPIIGENISINRNPALPLTLDILNDGNSISLHVYNPAVGDSICSMLTDSAISKNISVLKLEGMNFDYTIDSGETKPMSDGVTFPRVLNPTSLGKVLDIPLTATNLKDLVGKNVADIPMSTDIPSDLPAVPDISVPDINTSLIQKIIALLTSLLSTIQNLFTYDPALTVDLSGFNNLVIKEKFPFSIPFDLYNAIKLFSASSAEPQFVVSIHNKFIDLEHEIDISILSTFIVFFRWVACVWFTIFLITKTRDMIKW